jgi:UDP-glucose 4-epimerase
MGFDGRIQLTHEDDALASLELCTVGDVGGTFNVAGPGVVMLSQAISRAGRVNLPLPTPLASLTRDVVRRFGYIDFTSEQVEYLKYGRVIDTSRIADRTDFAPKYSTKETFDSFLRAHPLGRVVPWSAATEEHGASVTHIGGG